MAVDKNNVLGGPEIRSTFITIEEIRKILYNFAGILWYIIIISFGHSNRIIGANPV